MAFIRLSRDTHDKHSLVRRALEKRPSLIIDCANVADPHALFMHTQYEALGQVYVVEVELLYKFRDVLLRAPDIVDKYNIKSIIITPFGGLFHYDNSHENETVLRHAFNLIAQLSRRVDVIMLEDEEG
jgi:hypothetical protein